MCTFKLASRVRPSSGQRYCCHKRLGNLVKLACPLKYNAGCRLTAASSAAAYSTRSYWRMWRTTAGADRRSDPAQLGARGPAPGRNDAGATLQDSVAEDACMTII